VLKRVYLNFEGFKMKRIVLFISMASLFMGCETGTKYEKNSVESTTVEQRRESNIRISDLIDEPESRSIKEEFNPRLHPVKYVNVEEDMAVQLFNGGVRVDGLNIKNIRSGKHSDYSRLVFDVYSWNAYVDSEEKKAQEVGLYHATYNPSRRDITVEIKGYRNFTATLPTFANSDIIEGIYVDKSSREGLYRFHIKLTDSAKVKVFDLANPARMVFDIKAI